MVISIAPSGVTPHYKRLMIFVDGTNLLCQLSSNLDIKFKASKPPLGAIAVSSELIKSVYERKFREKNLIRRYWFSSYEGESEENFLDLQEKIRLGGFEPRLYKREKGKEKGVDIGLAKEMLVNAFNQNFDVGLLVAGDMDYLELVDEVKRYGQIIEGAFIKSGLNKKLFLAFDEYYDIWQEATNLLLKSDPFKRQVEALRDFCKKNPPSK